MSPQKTWLTIPVQTVTADSAHSHICTSCWVSFFFFFFPSFCLNILRLHPPPPLCRCWLCLCAFVYIQFVIIWLWRSYSSGHPGSLCWRWDPLVAYFFFYIHANTHWVRTVCRFATNSSPFLKLFFWVVKLGLQLNVGWLSRHKLKRMNDYSYVFKIITGVFIKGFWMQLNFISVISTHKFFPLSLNFLSHSWRTGMLFSDHL